MKRHPSTSKPEIPGPDAMKSPIRQQYTPQDDGEALETWLVSGGVTTFLVAPSEALTFDPTFAGVQLVASQFVPRGKTGWIKQLRVAPYMPPELANPWQGWDATWQDFVPVGFAGTIRATAQAGVYTTPMGWESYFDTTSESLPEWHWTITLMPGTLEANRAAAGTPPFDPFNPASWWLVPDFAIPSSPPSPYVTGVPGKAIGQLRPQRMQVLQGDALVWHLLIPENTTACLWTYWKQSTTQVYARDLSGGQILVGPGIPPLLPSFGQMVGYMQATDRPAAIVNARTGWGG